MKPKIFFLVMVLLLSAGASLLVGAAGFGVPEKWIFWQLRLPRTLLAMLIGAGLGISGAGLQGALRNGLADPGLLGITGMASLGSVIVFYWGLSEKLPFLLPLGGMAGALLAILILLRLAGKSASGNSLILAGIAVSAMAASLVSLSLTLAPNPFALAEISDWLLGGITDRGMTHVMLAAPPILCGIFVLARLGPALDALTLGETTAASLGFFPARTLRLCAIGVALASGAGSAIAGGIAFVGLLLPHVLRPFFGERPGAILLPSAIFGAAVLTLADLLARGLPLLWPGLAEPRLGVITSLFGAPALIAILRRQNR
jgi:iron complex transport system permease protein